MERRSTTVPCFMHEKVVRFSHTDSTQESTGLVPGSTHSRRRLQYTSMIKLLLTSALNEDCDSYSSVSTALELADILRDSWVPPLAGYPLVTSWISPWFHTLPYLERLVTVPVISPSSCELPKFAFETAESLLCQQLPFLLPFCCCCLAHSFICVHVILLHSPIRL